MAENRHPGEFFQEAVLRGLDTIKSVVEGVTSALRVSDGALQQLDQAMITNPANQAKDEPPESTLIKVLAIMRSAMEEARQTGSVRSDPVVGRAKQILKNVTAAEPSWRTGPTIVNTTTDMARLALRDLRASNSLVKLATGQGEIDDLEGLMAWANEITNRVDNVQKAVATPKVRQAAKLAPGKGAGEASRPTGTETIIVLKRDLAKELYKAELDLARKLRIFGKPCDCLDSKHGLKLEASCEELIPYEPNNQIYNQIMDWYQRNRNKFTYEAIASGKYDEEYAGMAAELKAYRKGLMGTTATTERGDSGT